MSDRDDLAAVIDPAAYDETFALSMGETARAIRQRHALDRADAVLASDWLRDHDAEALAPVVALADEWSQSDEWRAVLAADFVRAVITDPDAVAKHNAARRCSRCGHSSDDHRLDDRENVSPVDPMALFRCVMAGCDCFDFRPDSEVAIAEDALLAGIGTYPDLPVDLAKRCRAARDRIIARTEGTADHE